MPAATARACAICHGSVFKAASFMKNCLFIRGGWLAVIFTLAIFSCPLRAAATAAMMLEENT